MKPSPDTSNADHFDLLPFIAILMCTLGVLLLVTLGAAALALNRPGENWVIGGAQARHSKIPILVEWDGTLATIHRDSRIETAFWKPPAPVREEGHRKYYRVDDEGTYGPALATLLSDLAADTSHYPLIAVRPSGFDTFGWFVDIFAKRKIAVGYEPIEQGRRVRLEAKNGRHDPPPRTPAGCTEAGR